MKVENVKTTNDIERYIEECINDFDADICNKDETIIAIAELVVHIYKLALKEKSQSQIIKYISYAKSKINYRSI